MVLDTVASLRLERNFYPKSDCLLFRIHLLSPFLFANDMASETAAEDTPVDKTVAVVIPSLETRTAKEWFEFAFTEILYIEIKKNWYCIMVS